MAEKREPLKETPLWIYDAGRLPDYLALILIFIGALLMSGFLSPSPGLLIEPICTLLRYWFGDGAIILSMLIFIFGLIILVLRYLCPRIRIFRLSLITTSFLLLSIFLIVLVLLAIYHGHEAGGDIGYALMCFLSPDKQYGFLSFCMWILLTICTLLLIRAPKWLPQYFSAVHNSFMDWKEENFPSPASASEVKLVSGNDSPHSDETRHVSPSSSSKAVNPQSVFDTQSSHSQSQNDNRQNITYNVKGTDFIMPKNSTAVRTNQLPPLNLLEPELGFFGQNNDHQEFIHQIEEAMNEFGAPVKVIGCSVGPCVIQYQVVPGSIDKETKKGPLSSKNIRVSQVAQAERDLAVRLGVSNLSIQAPVPGESFIGIDIPNPNAMKVRLRPLIESNEFQARPSPLNIALGRDISGKPVVVNLENMPHLLVAGTTSSGKSICLRSMATCLVMNNTPEQLRLVMIDPKRVEFFRFNGLPHLLGKVETEYDRSIAVLEWAVQEMKNRYQLFETVSARHLAAYNHYACEHGQKPLPFIVILIDEMAEIMKGSDKQGQECIDKLASLARATGMHLIVATQRPDTTIITGKIKTNIPARIALNVASAVDSRVIMGKQGAEKLLGHGDMYFIDPALNVPLRVQGPLLTDEEIEKVVGLWKKLAPKPSAEGENSPWEEIAENGQQAEQNKDEKKLKEAIKLVCRTRKASTAYISSKLNISFPTASRLLNQMEDLGVVGPMQLGGKSREVIWSEEEASSYGKDAGYQEDYDE